jgi:hypothetical protein
MPSSSRCTPRSAPGPQSIVLLRLHAAEHADHTQPLVFHRSGFGRLEQLP